jgi:hypothetical protein
MKRARIPLVAAREEMAKIRLILILLLLNPEFLTFPDLSFWGSFSFSLSTRRLDPGLLVEMDGSLTLVHERK